MLETRGQRFYLDNEPFRILSGSIHYFRVVPEYWRDRLEKLKACGLNTVETYLPWNVHEPKKGQFNFEGMADVVSFVKTAQELNLKVILRPAPYICAEWEFGGLPAWLLKDRSMELRTMDPGYIKHLDEYYDELIPRLLPLLSTNGGPVIAMQIENEYGGYGNDRAYMEYQKKGLIERGVDVLLFTSDGPDMIKNGSLPDVLTTLNFGSRPKEAFSQLEAFKPGSPKMCAEFWIGWFDHWTGEHHTRSAEDAAQVLDDMMAEGASFNYYMFHGGTNFGFYNGANHYEKYTPTITSYDYDALLTEWGDMTEKYELAREVLKKYTEVPEMTVQNLPKKAYGELKMTEETSLFDVLDQISEPVQHRVPLPMGDLNQNYGYTLYKTIVAGPYEAALDTTPIRDRAFIYANGEKVATVDRNDDKKTLELTMQREANILEIFVENMGRVNYGRHLKDRKGLITNIWTGSHFEFNWEMYPIELEQLPESFEKSEENRFPKFFRSSLHVEEAADTFIRLDGWKKGNVFVNGFNLGRYWEKGPQKTLYVPAPLLKQGENEIIVLELEGTKTDTIQFTDKPDLG